MAITTRTISRAKTLLKSDAWKGDHGFSGEGLTAWNAQREYFLSRLIEIITTRRKRIDWSSIPTCPREYQEDAGTYEGSGWTFMARAVIYEAVRRK